MRTRTAMLIGGTVVMVVTLVVIVLVSNPNNQLPNGEKTEKQRVSTDNGNKVSKPDGNDGVAKGRYVTYSDDKVAADGYEVTIVFFHASWCPECRGFDRAISSGDIREGVQILKADYDTSTKLRKRYGVTIQSTFVRVDDSGNKISLWSGYGKDKSINTILENT